MKFKSLWVGLVAVLLILASCGTPTGSSTPALTASPADSTAPASEPEPTLKAEPTSQPTPTPMPLPSLTVGETVTIENIGEITVDFFQITSDVKPPYPASFYSHYAADLGKTYVDLCIAYKNLATRDVDADTVAGAKLIYAGKYEYTGFSCIEEDNRGDFTYSSITSISPLSTEYLHYLFEVPEVIETSSGSLDAHLTVAGNTYSILIREGDDSTGISAIDTPSGDSKSGGTLTDKESVTLGGKCTFYVDFSQITYKVMPPQPASYYSYYEADDGKVYVDFCIAYQNLSTSHVEADDVLSAKLIYDGSYEFSGFSCIEEDSRGDFTYSSITSISPLATEYLHYLFELPDEASNSGKSIEITFIVGGNQYSYIMR